MGSCANTILAALPCTFHAALTLQHKGAPRSRWGRAGALALDAAVITFCVGVMGFGVRSAILSAGGNATAT